LKREKNLKHDIVKPTKHKKGQLLSYAIAHLETALTQLKEMRKDEV